MTWSRAVSFNRPGWCVRRGTGREAGPTVVEFIQQPRAYVVQEFARGKEIDQIFGDLGGWRRYGSHETPAPDRSKNATASDSPRIADGSSDSNQAAGSGPRPQTRRLNPAGFSPLAGRGKL